MALVATEGGKRSSRIFRLPKANHTSLMTLWTMIRLALMVAESICIQLLGFEVFNLEKMEEEGLGASYHQPLVICMIAGGVVVNYTSSRKPFLRILHDSSEPIYIAFFTLTGMTLALPALLPNLPSAALVFGLRLGGIAIGSYWGGRLGGSKPLHYEHYWMAFITQAGVALGLCSKVTSDFEFGPVIALCVTAEVVCAQILGPICFKSAIIAVGEAQNKGEAHVGNYAPGQTPAPLVHSASSRPSPRSAIVIGMDPDATALVSRLRARSWTVVQTDPQLRNLSAPPDDPSAYQRYVAKKTRGVNAPSLAAPLLGGASDEPEAALFASASALEKSLDVVVLMLPSHEESLAVCRLLAASTDMFHEIYGTQTTLTQLLITVHDPANEPHYLELKEDVKEHFKVTPIVQHAALPNLLAEVLHPECHWSHQLDNNLAGEEERGDV